MHYPIVIEPVDERTAWGVVVPDLPGCFSAGDTMEDALMQAEEAVAAWIEAALDAGQDIPPPSNIDAQRADHPELAGWLWAVVKVDPAALDDTIERVNISLPRRVLARLDALAREAGDTRSGFIARMALKGHQPEAKAQPCPCGAHHAVKQLARRRSCSSPETERGPPTAMLVMGRASARRH
jgi:predicted RNase H-like HicB family nuclease